ncbi:hypothetical protein AB0P19_02305 [Microbacterium oleivorans]|uniref:hypothetical protein n=1 Tax=Microbacterium oleivorans TaxID=273677 RepID=UPI00341701E3
MADIDASALHKLAADLGEVPRRSSKNFRQAIEVTARHVRDTARENATGMAHAPAFPYSITYDITGSGSTGTGSTLDAEIGPDKARTQGALGNLIEFGSINNPPQGIMHGALQQNEADFERGIDRAVDDALKAIGL